MSVYSEVKYVISTLAKTKERGLEKQLALLKQKMLPKHDMLTGYKGGVNVSEGLLHNNGYDTSLCAPERNLQKGDYWKRK